MRKNDGLHFMMLFVIATVCCPSKAVPQAGTSSDSPKQLSVLEIYRGELSISAVQEMVSLKFIKSVCNKPWKLPSSCQCFTRAADEEATLCSKDGRVFTVDYDFSGSKYDGIWNALGKRFGNPKAFIDRGGWLFDFWQDTDKKNVIEIMKIIDGTGSVELKQYDNFYDSIATQSTSSPSQYSKPISGKLQIPASHTTRYRGLYIGEPAENAPIKQSGCSTDSWTVGNALDNIGTGKSRSECIVSVSTNDSRTIETILIFTRTPFIEEYRALVAQYGSPLPGRYKLVDGDVPDSIVWHIKDGTDIAEKADTLRERANPGREIQYTIVEYLSR